MVKRALILSLVFLLPAVIHGTVLVPAEFREIVNGSDIIAYGRVTSTAVEWSDDRKHVDTLVTLQVGTYLKGGSGATIDFRVPGGTIGRYMNVMVGAPHFSPGDEVVIFLNARGRERPSVFGLNQGVFRVTLDSQTRRRMVAAPVMSRGDAREPVVRGMSARKPLPLETFGAQVETVLAETPRSAR